MLERRRIRVEGVVQGVGFRPFVLRLASARALTGFVRNDRDGVLVEVQGESTALDGFARDLGTGPPPLAVVERVRVERLPGAAASPSGFAIVASDEHAPTRSGTGPPPDVATCDKCVAELLDPADRRYRYPFISCTDCGPRLTIASALPFDRARTTMAAFPMCAECRREYEDPRDRRFHAQTIACAACGPTARFVDGYADAVWGDVAVRAAVAALLAGRIVAVKGLGGYHLACDATDADTVGRLRARKRRAAKPFGVMMADVACVRRFCRVSADEEALLRAPARPIVLLERLDGDAVERLEGVAPRCRELGVMLPYTPLHHLLLAGAGRPLVMTSGNRAGEPIVCDDLPALRLLGDVADAFLQHDRAIALRADDSVVRATHGTAASGGRSGGSAFVRRSRGHAPLAIPLAASGDVPVLGVGGHLKNVFCLADARGAFLSPHVGDLDHPDARQALRDALARYRDLLGVVPRVVAHDLHPDYASTRVALELEAESHVAVQHHHAHVAACAAEHGVAGPVLGVAFDGSGLGTDGAVWGGELLLVDGAECERLGHVGYVPLPGGDAAARAPWRSAAAHLWSAYGDAVDGLTLPSPAWRTGPAWPLVRQMLRTGAHSPPTSSVGRLFDAVASLVGLRQAAEFEGQAAMELEASADRATSRRYPVAIRDGELLVADPAPIVRAVVDDVRAGRSGAEVAGAFHATMAELIAELAARGRERTGVSRVALSGGVFQNALLTRRAEDALARRGLTALVHHQVPCNDGGLALGQVAVAVRLAAAAVERPAEVALCV